MRVRAVGLMEFFVSMRYYGFDAGPLFSFFLAFLACWYTTAFAPLAAYISRGLFGYSDIHSHSGLVKIRIEY